MELKSIQTRLIKNIFGNTSTQKLISVKVWSNSRSFCIPSPSRDLNAHWIKPEIPNFSDLKISNFLGASPLTPLELVRQRYAPRRSPPPYIFRHAPPPPAVISEHPSMKWIFSSKYFTPGHKPAMQVTTPQNNNTSASFLQNLLELQNAQI